jgi:regulatory protein
VRDKLKSWDTKEELIPDILKTLYEEGFLDEQRYADAFATGKLKNNQWGRRKIRFELTRKGIPSHNIDQAIQNIDEDVYLEVLKDLIIRKTGQLTGNDPFIKKNKVIRYLNGKGFTYSEIVEVYNEINL